VVEAILRVVRIPYFEFIVQSGAYLSRDEKQAAEATQVVIKVATLGVRLVIVPNPASAEGVSPLILSKVSNNFRSA